MLAEGEVVRREGDGGEPEIALQIGGEFGELGRDDLPGGCFERPGVIKDPVGPSGFHDYYYGLYPSYGYNFAYLSPSPTCPDAYDTPNANCTVTPNTGTTYVPSPAGINPATGLGRALAGVEAPASTILMADSVSSPAGAPTNLQWGYFLVRPPQVWALIPPTAPDRETFGRVHPRHQGRVSAAFADGHVKAMSINSLRDANLWRAQKVNP